MGQLGSKMHALLTELFPICRSITGDGVRQTLDRLRQETDLDIYEVPSGTHVFDWTVPQEWNVREAWIEGPDGRRVVDFVNNNLHLVSYSEAIDQKMPLEVLQRHLHSLPESPDWIPYKTSYYQSSWGFCLTHREREKLVEGEYRVFIDSTKHDGALTYGEVHIPGDSADEFLISTHVCHPSMANDNLSGLVVASELVKNIRSIPNRKLSYRILYLPGTIGAITWLAMNQETTEQIKYGLVISGLGDSGTFTYKRSRRGNARIDRLLENDAIIKGFDCNLVDFSPYGYDERQFCSPGFDLPLGSLSRSPYGTYPEYHTSADNAHFVSPESLAESLTFLKKILEGAEEEQTAKDGLYWRVSPHCEVQLGRRGLYGADGPGSAMSMLWVLNFSDGNHTLADISERSNIPLNQLVVAADTLLREGLLRRNS